MLIRAITALCICLTCGLLQSSWAQPHACSCADKKDLINRLNVIEAAIIEYKEQIVGIQAREAADGKPLMWTQQLYDTVLQARVNQSMQNVADPTAKYGTAKTNGGDCELEFLQAPSVCLIQTLSKHEKVHQNSCSTYKGSLGLAETYQTRMRLEDFAQEEIVAYLEERAFILAELKALPTGCRPVDWFGFVFYQEITKRDSTRTIPPNNTGYRVPSAGIIIGNGGNSTQTIESGYLGTMFIEKGKLSSAKATASYTRNDSTVTTGRIFCNQKDRPDLAYSNSTSDMLTMVEQQTGAAGFKLNEYPAQKRYSISISFFPVSANGSRVLTESNPAPCIGRPKTLTSSPQLNMTAASYTIKGTITNPNFLWGNESYAPPARQIHSPTSNVSYTVNTRWMLRRL